MNKNTQATGTRTGIRGGRAASYGDCWQLRSRTVPPAETVRDWLRTYRATGCLKSREKVIEAHMQLIAHFAKKCASNRAPFDDLMAEGAVILMRSIDLYDMDRGVPFAAYAAAALKVGLLGASARTHEAWRARARWNGGCVPRPARRRTGRRRRVRWKCRPRRSGVNLRKSS